MKKIVLANQKGGVAKTTTAYALAVGLHNKGKKVLVMDCDPQSNLSFTAGVDLAHMERTLYGAMRNEYDITDTIQTLKPGFDIVTIGLRGASVDLDFASEYSREHIISNLIKPLEYDYCIIDTPPTLSLLTVNVLTASDKLIIPLTMDIYSLQGIAQLRDFIKIIQTKLNPDLKVMGLLITRYNERLNLTQALTESVEKAAGTLETVVFNTRIRETTAVKETQLAREDLFKGASKANATADYLEFVNEFLEKEK